MTGNVIKNENQNIFLVNYFLPSYNFGVTLGWF